MSTFCYSQDTLKNETKWKLGFSISPELGSKLDQKKDNYPEKTNKFWPKYALTYGTSINYQYSKNLGFFTGLDISHKGYNRKISEQYYSFPAETPTYVIERKNCTMSGIVLGAFYMFGKKNISWIGQISTSLLYYLSHESKAVFVYRGNLKNFYSIESTPLANNIDLTISPAFGIQFKLNNRLELKTLAVYRQSVLAVEKISTYNRYLYSTGINFGILYTLGNN